MNILSSATQRRPRTGQQSDNPPAKKFNQFRNDITEQDLPTRPYSSPRLRNVFLLCLAFRSAVGLVGQKTFFQPDEFYQSLEPAHRMVWGTGYETWEWRDSFPGLVEGANDAAKGSTRMIGVDTTGSLGDKGNIDWKTRIRSHILDSPGLKRLLLGISPVQSISDTGCKTGTRPLNGLLRSWVWPLLFAFPYWALKVTGLDKVGSVLILAPRLPMILLAALTDFYTYRLAGRVLGNGYREAALFLSLTNLFHAHALTRTLTTSAETCLTVIALYYWPLPLSEEASRWSANPIGRGVNGSTSSNVRDKKEVPDVPTALRLNDDQDQDNLTLSLALSAVAFVLRPTNIVLWSFLGTELCIRSWKASGRMGNVIKLVGQAAVIGALVIAVSVAIDFCVTGRWYFPFLTFLAYNIVFGVSDFYGSSAWHYHLTQSIPILLTTALPFFVPSFLSTVRCSYPQWLAQKGNAGNPRKKRVALLTKAVIFTLAIWSCIGHKEWRFLHPILPILLLYPTQYLVDHYHPPEGGLWTSRTACAHTFLRMNRRPFLYLLLSPILPYLYLSTFHGRGQVDVTGWLREQVAKQPDMSVLFTMPCHSTPWMSHIHLDTSKKEDHWHFLTCEPILK
ncbi:glycosylphosphatidylinositol anchor biosynthesis [Naganishia albida]|nr:glycosylphosphatidylinositol anchor biosynthesis [Naganishia albida]